MQQKSYNAIMYSSEVNKVPLIYCIESYDYPLILEDSKETKIGFQSWLQILVMMLCLWWETGRLLVQDSMNP